MDGVEEHFSAAQAQKLYDALTCPKELMLFEPSIITASLFFWGTKPLTINTGPHNSNAKTITKAKRKAISRRRSRKLTLRSSQR